MKLSRSHHDEPEVNLISLIDVLFVLVIFLLVTTTFAKQSGLRLELPQASPAPETATDPGVTVAVDRNGRFYLGEQAVVNSRPETLRRALEQSLGTDRDRRVAVRADGRASHQAVVTVFDVLAQMGIRDVVIETVQPTESP
ncbi:ExbD/TolR family protein [Candidatus Macondimonas diazotrophica]|jgi:biopolymer transport protein ExbD|uniref:Biopolymer transporter ExbD n=1 Tax=Candidatus Macondimonas diazotrophica TaxID=2305248 RepID=A0A4Z0FAL3_9GAMM|nr:biopolymer transporter ExbD [Candidatus Macondimonas diazotrophica]NCU01129.1 biopolymer transporter ExbD [Candidatus Macondimonas diazotrophica]TFZ82802.1 biopolymer transporter ExbD [Candidatus Macondimonas diazotrophica]HBG52065.1 biopolymer transporter ExbD [Gammaproteobacteria bacterium]